MNSVSEFHERDAIIVCKVLKVFTLQRVEQFGVVEKPIKLQIFHTTCGKF